VYAQAARLRTKDEERRAETPGGTMDAMLQGMVIIGGLTFSLAASLLVEELIFGRIVRLAFVRQPRELSVPSSHSATATKNTRKQEPRAKH
jgi:hypothetical protein